MECINTVLATNILKFRQIQGMTQKELAEKLGVSNQSISKWETAKSTPDIALLPILLMFFTVILINCFPVKWLSNHISIYARNFLGPTIRLCERFCATAEKLLR